jgi:hypothetical protein
MKQTPLVELVWQGKDQVKVGYGEQIFLPLDYPSFAVRSLTFRTMAVRTRVIGDTLMSAFVASIDMPTEGSGTAFGNGIEHTLVLSQWMMLLLERITKPSHHLSQFADGPE